MAWLSSQSAWVLVVLFLAISLFVGLAGRLSARALIPSSEREAACGIAAALMTAFAASFALLTAITLANEATALSSAQSIVSMEAANASTLAWASTAPGVSTAPIQTALRNYLHATRTYEWQGNAAAYGNDPATDSAIATLERVVRSEAARRSLPTSTSNELLSSLDGLSGQRRQRLASASRQLPNFYVITVIVTGLALIANASVVAMRSGLRGALVASSLSVLVALSVALLFALDTPWQGAIHVSGSPIDAVISDLGTGYFHS
jgi:hypothetical protein